MERELARLAQREQELREFRRNRLHQRAVAWHQGEIEQARTS
jgi:hypothetical protein